MEQLLKKYNSQETLLVISSYPEKGVVHSGKVCAVGWVVKKTIESLKKEFLNKGEDSKIVVLTLTINGKTEVYEEDGILVIRCFRRDKLSSYIALVKHLLRLNKVKDVLVEFEFASFGNTLVTGFFPGVLWFMKILNKRIVLVLHQVIFELDELSGHVGMKKGGVKGKMYSKLLGIFYKAICLPAEKVVVLEGRLKARLSKVVAREKIAVIPHGVDASVKPMSKELARRKLSIKMKEKVVLYFGYLAWYKGVDWLLESIDTTKVRLIIAGGPSFTQKNKSHYKKFIKKVYKLAREKGVEITGFLDEREIPVYFGAADVVVLPYRTFMSSSGPLAIAQGLGKPFLISEAGSKVLDSVDFKQSMRKMGLEKENLVFRFDRRSLNQKISRSNLQKLALLSKVMRERREFEFLAFKYFKLFKTKRRNLATSFTGYKLEKTGV